MTAVPSPEWTIDGLRLHGNVTYDKYNNDYDTNGWAWHVVKEKGFINSAKPRTDRVARVNHHGAFRTSNFRDTRIVTLEGALFARTPEDRERAEIMLAALCSDPVKLYEFRRRAATVDQVIYVELDDAPMIEAANAWRLEWSFQFAAPDPRKHDWVWQQPSCRPAGPTPAGLEFPLNFAGGGLDFGNVPRDSTIAQVGNYGTAPAYPLFRLEGPLSSPTILHRESGRAIRYVGDLAAGEVLHINCDDYAQRGVLAHSAVSSTRGSVATLVVRESRDWPVVNPQTSASFQLRGYGQLDASLRIGLRSAFW